MPENYCKLCTRYFYGDETSRVKNNICDYCEAKITQLKENLPIKISREELEELVAQEQRARLQRLSPEGWRRQIRESDKRDKEV